MNHYPIWFNDHVLAHRNNQCELKLQVAKKIVTSPLFKEENFLTHRSWEVRYDNGYPNVIYDCESKQFRCYYTVFVKDDFSAQTPLIHRKLINYQPKSDRVTALCVAISEDGLIWEKPELHIVEFNGSKANNIVVLFAHGSSVLYDKTETNPSKRYKLLTKIEYSKQYHFMAVAFSQDGFDFNQLIPWSKHNPQADTHNFVHKDHLTNQYHLITRIWKNGVRVAALSTSNDFLDWSEPKEILRGHGFDHQVYSMPIFQVDQGYLGFPSIYHEGDRSHPDFDKVDCTLAFSKEIDHWDFVNIHQKLIERGVGEYPFGEFDCGCIYASAPILKEEEFHIYYMGGNGQHTNFRETALGLATIQRNKLAYYQPQTGKKATFCTAPFYLLGSQIYMTMEGCHLETMKVSLLYRSGEVALDDQMMKVSQDNERVLIKIPEPISELYQQPMLLEIQFKYGKLYDFGGDIKVAFR